MEVILANNRDYWARLDSFVRADELKRWQDEDHLLSESALTWGDHPGLIVSWKPIPSSVATRVCRAFGRDRPRELTVDGTTARVDDVTRRILTALGPNVATTHELDVISWGPSPVADVFRRVALEAGWPVSTRNWPIRPESALEYDRKDVFRLNFGSLLAAKGTPMPTGVVVPSVGALTGAVRSLNVSAARTIAKSALGTAGWGIARLSEEPPHMKSGIWQSGPIVLEEWIDGVYSPTVQALVEPDGNCRVLMMGRQRIGPSLGYEGLENGRVRWPGAVGDLLHASAEALGRALYEVGYVGWFDIDYIMARDGTMYCLEANLRRTMVTPLWEILRRGSPSRTVESRYVSTDDGWEERVEEGPHSVVEEPAGWIALGSRGPDGRVPCAVWADTDRARSIQWRQVHASLTLDDGRPFAERGSRPDVGHA